jgi:hypothetical protein
MKIEIKDWVFPNKEKSKIVKKIEKEANAATDYVNTILKFSKLGLTKEAAYKKMEVHLIKEGKLMDDYFTSVFEKVWSEAEDVLKHRTVKDITLPKVKDPKLASSLLTV